MMHGVSEIILIATLVMAAGTWISDHNAARSLTRMRKLVEHENAATKTAPTTSSTTDLPLPPVIGRYLRRIGISPRRRDAYIVFLALLALAGGTAVAIGPAAAAAVTAAAILAFYGGLNLLSQRRAAQLSALLPGFFERLRQLLSVGSSLPTAFARAVAGSPPQLVKFFQPILRRLHHGAGFSETIRQSAEDVDIYEMRLFATAVSANTRFGGSLVHSLDNLVLFLRKRSAMERELHASTSQIRASAWVLALLPVFVGSLIVVQNRDYAGWFLSNPSGRKMLIYCLGSQFLGVLIMRQIVKTRF